METNKTNGESIDLVKWFQVLWNRKKFIIFFTSFFTIVSIVISLILPTWYSASVKILPQGNSSGGIMNQYKQIMAMVGVGSSMDFGDMQEVYPTIIKSNYILDTLLMHEFNIGGFSEPLTLIEFWDEEVDKTELNWEYELYFKAKEKLKEDYIHTDLDVESGVFVLTVLAPKDPNLSAAIANFIIEKLEYYNKLIRKYKTREERLFIEKNIEEAKIKLMNAEEKLKTFKEVNVNYTSPELSLEMERLNTELQVNKTIYIELRKQLELTKIEEVRETEIINILEKAIPSVEKEKPKRKIIVIVSWFLAFMLSIMIAVLKPLYISFKNVYLSKEVKA